MTVIVTGAHGQVGRCLVALGGEGITRAELDLASAGTADFRTAVSSLFADGRRPDVMINTAAWTDVDGAEDVTNRRTVEAVNAIAPGELARAAADAGTRFIHISTDYVFSGAALTADAAGVRTIPSTPRTSTGGRRVRESRLFSQPEASS